MPYFSVRQKVKDHAKWKQVFDENAAARATVGSKGGYVYRNSDDPNEVFVLLEVTDLQKFITAYSAMATLPSTRTCA